MRLAPRTPNGQRRLHVAIAASWGAFGVFGLVDHVAGLGLGIDQSIPVLFAISVYANVAAHLAGAAGARAEDAATPNDPDDPEDVYRQWWVDGPKNRS